MTMLPTGVDVELWWTRLVTPEPIDLADRCRELLSPDEREYEHRLRRDELRQRWRWTRAMVRSVLSHYASTPPGRWRFRRTSLGKPELIGPSDVLPRSTAGPLRFNVAHSGEMIICGVSDLGEIGVDVERIHVRPRLEALARRFFAPAEAAWLFAQPAARQQESFFRLWTLKEAYLKARGTGLALPLTGFAVSPDEPGGPTITFTDRCPDDPTRWRMAERDEWPGYRLAIALRAPAADQPPRVRARQISPLGEEPV